MTNKEDQQAALRWSYQVLDLPAHEENRSDDHLMQELATWLDQLIVSDFNRLIGLLYRIDVSQDKATAELAANAGTETPGQAMARLIIERQLEKIRYRKRYSQDRAD